LTVADDVLTLIEGRRGHFRFEAGHHGDLWFDLETLCARPRRIRPFAADLARRISSYQVDGVCGPLTEGAFIAMLVASELDVEFSYAERVAHPERDALFSVEYQLPPALRAAVRGKRIAVVNDVISAGSAVRGTFADLEACGAQVIAVGALLVLGSAIVLRRRRGDAEAPPDAAQHLRRRRTRCARTAFCGSDGRSVACGPLPVDPRKFWSSIYLMFSRTPVACRRSASLLALSTPSAVVSLLSLIVLLLIGVGIVMPTTSG
jgi:orotate phosphoribosyltransferase